MEYLIVSIDNRSVTAARFTLSGRSAGLDGSEVFPLDGGETLADVVRTIAAGIRSPLRIVLCLPPQLFAHRIVSLPLTDVRKVREILPGHLQGEIAIPAEEAVFDALPAAEGNFLALWARRDEISRSIEIFREAGCEPQVVSAIPFGWSGLSGISDDCAVSDGSSLAIMAKGRLSFFSALDTNDPVASLTATLTALELSGTILPTQLFLFGIDPTPFISASLPLTVVEAELPTELAVLFRSNETYRQLAGHYAVARACQAGTLPDFRRGGLAWTAGDAALRRQLRLSALLAATVLVLLFVWKGLQYRAVKGDIASLNRSIGAIYREIFPGRVKAVDELAEVKGEIRKLSGIENGGMVLDTLKKLAEAKGGTINGLFETEIEGRTVRLKGDARSAQAVNEFKAALSGVLATAETGEVKSRPDGSVTFTLTGTIKEGAR